MKFMEVAFGTTEHIKKENWSHSFVFFLLFFFRDPKKNKNCTMMKYVGRIFIATTFNISYIEVKYTRIQSTLIISTLLI